MNRKHALALITVAACCATSSIASHAGSKGAEASAAACGPIKATFDVDLKSDTSRLTPANNNAVVYVIQDTSQGFSSLTAPILTTRIGLDGEWVGANRRQSHYGWVVSPGVHHLCVSSQWSGLYSPRSTSLYRLDTQSGTTYYFRVRVPLVYPGPNLFILDLQQVDQDEGEFLLETTKQSVPRPKESK